MSAHPTRHLVLLGTELAHVHLLAHLRQHPLAGVQVTLITQRQRLIYRPLLAGFVAGRHSLDDCAIALQPLLTPSLAAGNTRWPARRAAEIDAAARKLRLDDGQEIKFDWLSINTELLQDRDAQKLALPGARAHGLFVHPVDTFCALWPRVHELAATRALRVAVIGGQADAAAGAAASAAARATPIAAASPAANARASATTSLDARACAGSWPDARWVTALIPELAIELALAIRHRLPGSAVTLITGGAPLGHSEPVRLQRCLAEALRQRNVTVLADRATHIMGSEILLASGARLACDVPVIATGAYPPLWLAGSGLALDSQGQIAVDANAQSTSHPHVFATGQRSQSSRCESVKHGSVMYGSLTSAQDEARVWQLICRLIWQPRWQDRQRPACRTGKTRRPHRPVAGLPNLGSRVSPVKSGTASTAASTGCG